MDAAPRRNQPLYPSRYVWFVFLSAMDVFMTFIVLWFGGREANQVADWILQRFGIAGMTVFKFALVVFVILLCEFIGRRDFAAGRRLAGWAIVLTCLPVVIAFILLLQHQYGQAMILAPPVTGPPQTIGPVHFPAAVPD